MRIGNSAGLDIFTLAQARNNRHQLLSSKMPNKSDGYGQQSQIQRQRCLAEYMDFAPPDHYVRQFGVFEDTTGLTPEDHAERHYMSDPVNRANAFLHGRPGRHEEGLGVIWLREILGERGIELPDNARFEISFNKYGRVTISGLEDAELQSRIEEAMSYDFRLVHGFLGDFVRSTKVLEGLRQPYTNPFSPEQTRLLQIQSDLADYGVGLHDLKLVNGRIVGLPQELHDKIYGDRSDWLSGMEPLEAESAIWNINRIRDSIIHFLQNGTAHIPNPDITLTFDNGRMFVDVGGNFNQNSGSGFDVSA